MTMQGSPFNALSSKNALLRSGQAAIAKMDELRNHLNGLINKPQSLVEKLDSLGADQVQTYRQRQAAGEITRQGKRDLDDAETPRSIAELVLKKKTW